MLPFAAALLGFSNPLVSYVGGFAATAGTSAVLGSYGAQVGDVATYASGGGSSVSSPGGAWTGLGNDGSTDFFYRILTAPDIASGVTTSISGTVAIYRGTIVSIARRATATNSGSGTASVTGFTKNAAHVGLLVVSAAANTVPGSISPATFASRVNTASGTRRFAYDRLTPPNSAYVDGTGFSQSHTDSLIFSIYELRSA